MIDKADFDYLGGEKSIFGWSFHAQKSYVCIMALDDGEMSVGSLFIYFIDSHVLWKD
jgi:hypothetical protein